ncbi:MAG: adenylate/guanylate cyclase domain-containing protein [bacterium]
MSFRESLFESLKGAFVEESITEYTITVLLVDDSPTVCEAISEILSEEKDITFHYCTDPEEEEAVAERVRPTVILQDLVMPGIDGLTMVKKLRENEVTRDVPMIVLSAEEDPQIKAKAFETGANDFMVKFPDTMELVARIRHHSKSYINLLQRNEAYRALVESQRRLELRNRFIMKTFGRYLSDEVVNQLLETPEGLHLGGEKRKVTIMMSDLRGFTSISEKLQPEQVMTTINNYLETMTTIIFKYHGTIVEFIGDAILSVFGAPTTMDDDAASAVACAVEMQLAMDEVNERNRNEGLPRLNMGIGINTGEVIVGNIGSVKRVKYGVVGRNVNLASRIESLTIGGQILISESTRYDIGDILKLGRQMEVETKGIDEPITVFEVLGLGGDYALYLPECFTEELLMLQKEIPVKFVLVKGKVADSSAYTGSILRLSPTKALVKSQTKVDELSDVKFLLVGQNDEDIPIDLYAKVVGQGEGTFLVHFTSMPKVTENYLRGILETCQ